jgi:hypothetical protein
MPMRARFQLQYHGKRYWVERGRDADSAAQRGGGLVGPSRWYVTLGGIAVGSLPAQPRESAPALRVRVRQWLAQLPDLEDRDRLYLGGG